MTTANRQFDFSVIIPIYNTEEYLEESINSIVQQTIGFKKHIQLVLINDGSTDDSESICLRFKEKYPDNIIYKYKENGGVASACNAGLELAEGTYVNFFGSDDIWSKEVFAEAKRFFDSKNGSLVDLVSFRIFRFDKVEQEHMLNYKYDETRLVDLKEEFSYIHPLDGDCIIRRSAITGMKFDTSIHYMEDALFICELLLKKCKCGVISKGCYYNRKRVDGSNLSTFVGKLGTERYLETPHRVFEKMFEISKKYTGEIQRFVQFTILYEMQWRLTEKLPPTMDQTDINNYTAMLRSLLKQMEDIIILKQNNVTFAKRVFFYKLKHGDDFFSKLRYEKGEFYNDGFKVLHVKGQRRCTFYVVERDDNYLVLKGSTDLFCLNTPFKLFVRDQEGKEYYPSIEDLKPKEVRAFNQELILRGNELIFKLPLVAGNCYTFYLQISDEEEIKITPFYGLFGKFDPFSNNSFWRAGEYIIKSVKGRLRCNAYTRRSHVVSECRLLYRIIREGYEDKWAKFFARLAYYFFGWLYKGKDIWLISDRNYHATDSGAALFKYICSEVNDKTFKVFFVLSRGSINYQELKRYGRIIDPDSYKYKVLHLLADKIISAYFEDMITQPFRGQARYLADLFNHKYVYLQHGIMQGDLSHFLNVLKKNIKLLPTSTIMETNHLLQGDYGYDSNVVQPLGLTRLDSYYGYSVQKKVVFLPTWRQSIAAPLIPHSRERRKVSGFEETDYCKFYNALINNDRLITAMQQYGYQGEFYVHPSFAKQRQDFHGNDTIPVMKREADYPKVIGESSLLITDFSGVQFDFAYLRKPIVYSQFDSIDNRDAHSYNYLFFNYEEQGFGPIAHTVDETVNYIIDSLKHNCVLEEKYQKRIDTLFYYNDNQNSKRVYEAIMKL